MTGAPGLDNLTPRQRQTLDVYGRLGSVKAAAHQLGIAPRTAKGHLDAARSRLSAETLVQAVLALAESAMADTDHSAVLDGVQPRGMVFSHMEPTGLDLAASRRRAGLTQDQLAERLGLCRQRISAAEGFLRVTPGLAARWMAALEIGA